MNTIARLRLAGSIALIGATHAVTVLAAPAAIELPPVTAKLRASKLPGYAVATQKCAICHSADYVNYQPPGMNQAQWTAEMSKMQHAYGAPISDTDVAQIGAYLAVAYGSAHADDAAIVTASSTPAVAPTASAPAVATVSAAIDVQPLLAANACLSCHALTQKIIGPAYHDVAEKYKSDPQALVKLGASIRGGSVGKWGPAPMPAFAGLSEAQVKALATYVLAQ